MSRKRTLFDLTGEPLSSLSQRKDTAVASAGTTAGVIVGFHHCKSANEKVHVAEESLALAQKDLMASVTQARRDLDEKETEHRQAQIKLQQEIDGLREANRRLQNVNGQLVAKQQASAHVYGFSVEESQNFVETMLYLTETYSTLAEDTHALDRYVVQLNLYLSFRFMVVENHIHFRALNQDVLTFAYGIAARCISQENTVLCVDQDARSLTTIESAVVELLLFLVREEMWSSVHAYVTSALWTMDTLREQWKFVDYFLKGKLNDWAWVRAHTKAASKFRRCQPLRQHVRIQNV